MKKLPSKHILVLLTILVLFLFPAFVLARAGGGDSYGGGGFDSVSSGGSFSSDSNSSGSDINVGDLGWLFFWAGGNNTTGSGCLTFIIIIIIIAIIIRSRRGGRWENSGTSSISYGDGINNTNRSMDQETIKARLASIHDYDPDFDLQKFKGYVKKVFMAVQKGWTDRDQIVCRPFMAEDIYQSHDMQIEDMKTSKIINILQNIVVGSVDLARIDLDEDFDKITVKLRASMKDYKVNADNPDKPINGTSKDQLPPFTEYWVFIRKAKTKTKIKNGFFDRKCPNCGAAISVDVAGKCKYCNAMVVNGDFDWVLSEIIQKEEWAE